jgi:hypothetical protein
MHRRIWIKQVLIVGGGVLILPACNNEEGASSVALRNISITRKEEGLLSEIAETIIPATDTPGAKALNLHQFVLKMMDDCYDNEEQKKILTGFKEFDNYCKKTTGNRFVDLSKENKLSTLKAIGKGQAPNNDLKFFLDQVRRWTIRGYDSSEYVLTKINPYQLAPGHFEGCKQITKTA